MESREMEQHGSRFTHVHQVLPSLHVADASGAHTLKAREALRAAGYRSELFVDLVDAPLAHEVRRFDELDRFVAPDATAIIYQLAVGSWVVDSLIARKEPLLVNYHNLTPASFFWKWAPDWLDAVALGRSQLHALAKRTSHTIAVSEFNESDLLGAGYLSTSVVPPFVDVAPSQRPRPVRNEPGRRESGPTTWLFVGKLLPHKAAHDLVTALATYRRAYDSSARLVLVGGHPVASYAAAVRDYAGSLGLSEAVSITGATSSDELALAYASSHVFVCLSEHEGFCFPLLEAMNNGLPVVAYSRGRRAGHPRGQWHPPARQVGSIGGGGGAPRRDRRGTEGEARRRGPRAAPRVRREPYQPKVRGRGPPSSVARGDEAACRSSRRVPPGGDRARTQVHRAGRPGLCRRRPDGETRGRDRP